MSFFTTFKKLCGIKGISPTKATLEMGLSNAAYAHWQKGATPKQSTVKKVADYFGVDVALFYDNEAEEEKPQIITGQALGALIMMPVIGSVKAGYGAEAVEDYTGGYQYIGADMVHNRPQEYRVLEVKGDSMYPFFLEGDRVVVHLQPEAENGETVVAILCNGDGTIKKLHIKEDGSMELIPANAMYPPIQLRNGDRIYGKVVNLIRNL